LLPTTDRDGDLAEYNRRAKHVERASSSTSRGTTNRRRVRSKRARPPSGDDRRTNYIRSGLVDAYLARIRAYDHAGPSLNAIVRLNPNARSDAAALDAERKAGRVRGPLHGIPIILKDNYGTRDFPNVGRNDRAREPADARRCLPSS
jgi:Asp-tRNA(Asn)/Glu-tRNA(Gln) amidotransferase A subunit family amidase